MADEPAQLDKNPVSRDPKTFAEYANPLASTGERNKFHITDILSVTSGRIVSRDYVDGLYEIISFLMDKAVPPSRLEQAREICRSYLMRQMPELQGIDTQEVNPDTYDEWVEALENRFGAIHTLKPLPEDLRELPIASDIGIHPAPQKTAEVKSEQQPKSQTVFKQSDDPIDEMNADFSKNLFDTEDPLEAALNSKK